MSSPRLKHLTSISSLDRDTILFLLKKATSFLKTHLAQDKVDDRLAGKVVTHLFFEPSTRTRNSFTIAAKRLGALTLAPHMEMASIAKGETLLDTIHSFEAMGTSAFVIRHTDNRVAEFVSSELQTDARVINAGDGYNEHPTQALLDLLTIQQHKPDFESIQVAIIGDVLHSRVARSLIKALTTMGTSRIRVIAPPALIPENAEQLGVEVCHSLRDGLQDVDVAVALRIQKERMQAAEIPDPEEFNKTYGLTTASLAYAKPDAIVMHPGPINRGVEINSKVADGKQSVILEQVRNGVAIRMAVLDALLCE